MKISKKGLGRVALEFLSIVFAVLLALGLNHWREARINQQLAEGSFDRIQQEIIRNTEELKTSLQEFDNRIEAIATKKGELVETGTIADMSWSYAHPVLAINAWKTAAITQAVLHMEPDQVEQLADIYSIQEMYMEFGFKFFDRVPEMSRFKNEPDVMIEIIETHYAISRSIAETLLTGYQEFLEEYPPVEG
ncbi:MAG: hypothetical protein KI790_04450 [Cyclobacteriaceae bacterium]|nr:hypothetical protein [Cyclobacteriaceae bacterium HetDA_MAG_MS6]